MFVGLGDENLDSSKNKNEVIRVDDHVIVGREENENLDSSENKNEVIRVDGFGVGWRWGIKS